MALHVQVVYFFGEESSQETIQFHQQNHLNQAWVGQSPAAASLPPATKSRFIKCEFVDNIQIFGLNFIICCLNQKSVNFR